MTTTLKPIAPYVIGQVVGRGETSSFRREMCTVDGQWFAVATEGRQEELAKGEIAKNGLITYWPQMPRQERHGRGQTRFIFRSMFPSVVFVKCLPVADHWGMIKSSRGVRRLLGADGPHAIKDGEIDVVKLREAEAAAEEAERAHRAGIAKIAKDKGKSGLIWDFSAEETVRIKHGPFAGFYAQLTAAVDEHDRIKALVHLFGRSSSIELTAFDVERP